MLFCSHQFDRLHIAVLTVQHRWATSRCCPHVHLCIHMYFYSIFYLYKLCFSYFACSFLLIICFCIIVNLCFGIFYKNTFSCAVVSLKVRTPKSHFPHPVLKSDVQRKTSLLEKHFSHDFQFSPFYYLSVLTDTQVLAGIFHGWNIWHKQNSSPIEVFIFVVSFYLQHFDWASLCILKAEIPYGNISLQLIHNSYW